MLDFFTNLFKKALSVRRSMRKRVQDDVEQRTAELAPANAVLRPSEERLGSAPQEGGGPSSQAGPAESDGRRTLILLEQRKRFEEELRQRLDQLAQAEAHVRSVVNNVVDGIITIDGRGEILTVNPAAERIFGYKADEIVGQNVKVLMPEPYRGEHDCYLANYLRTGQAKIIGIGREVVGRRKDGSTFPMDLGVSEFLQQEKRYFTGIVRDITERKRSEKITRFLADASHTRPPWWTTNCEPQLAPIRSGLRTCSWSAGASRRR